MKREKTCMATQLIAELQRLVAEHGDHPVFLDDPDTGWSLPIGVVFADKPARERLREIPARFAITAEYDCHPPGDEFYTVE